MVPSVLQYNETQLIEVRENETISSIEFQFVKGIDVTVKVVDPDGKPVEGSEVTEKGELSHHRSETKKSDKDGSCIFTGQTEGTPLSFYVEHPELQLKGEGEIEATPGAELIINLEKYETTDVEGHVYDEEGNPMPGVELKLIHWKASTGSPSTAATTDSTGKYKVENLIMGNKYSLMAEAEGYSREEVPIHTILSPQQPLTDVGVSPVKKEIPAIDVIMRKADRWIDATITDEEGNPVSGSRIFSQGSSSLNRSSFSDSKGHFRMDMLATIFENNLHIAHVDFGDYSFRFMPTNMVHNFILIKKQYTLEGKVVDAENNPLEGASVGIDPQEHDSGRVYMRTTTDSSGNFRIEHVLDEEVEIQVGYQKDEELYWKRFKNVRTNEGNVTLIFDEPDENKRPEFEFDPRGVVMLEGKSAHELNVKRWINGEPVRLKNLKGKIVVLDFCKSTPVRIRNWWRIMKAVQKEYDDNRVVCIGIHENTDNIELVEKFLRDEGITYRVAIDKKSPHEVSSGKTFDTYGYFRKEDFVNYIIIDKNGNVHQDISPHELDKTIKRLLKVGVQK